MIEAQTVVLNPVDTRQLHRIGFRVTPEVIGADLLVGEKRELQGRQLQRGEEVTIKYVINGNPADVTYAVRDVRPPDSSVGEKTVVIIQGEQSSRIPSSSADGTLTETERRSVQDCMAERWELWHEALVLGRAAGFPVGDVERELRSLEESVLRFTSAVRP